MNIHHIMRAVHIVPKFDTKDAYMLNGSLFEYA
jgi:hypothetical protein